MEMTSLWKPQNGSHRDLEISLRTRDSHIPTARTLSPRKKQKRSDHLSNGSGQITCQQHRQQHGQQAPLADARFGLVEARWTLVALRRWRTASADPGKSCAPDVGTLRGPTPQSIFGADSLILDPAEVFASHAERGGPNQSGRIGGLVRLRTLPSPSPS